jgi:hypothetical protein
MAHTSPVDHIHLVVDTALIEDIDGQLNNELYADVSLYNLFELKQVIIFNGQNSTHVVPLAM